jgi:hypothetical protein
MKNYIYIIMIALLPFSAFSQPIINITNMPQTGDEVMISICSDPINPGASGMMQTWDMSSLTQSEEQSFVYVEPETAPRIDSFPDANLVAQNWTGDFSYYQVTSSGLKILGHVISIPPDDTSMVVYDEAEQLLELPYTFNDSHTSGFTGSSWVPGFGEFPFDGSLDFEADGYGTLILPTGSYENVVRYHFYREQTNYVNGIPAGTTTKEQWAWVSAEYRFWLLIMEENNDGFNTTSLVWYDKNPYPATTSGISELAKSQFHIFPNPVHAGQNLNVEWKTSEPVNISVFNTSGQLVAKQAAQFDAGTNAVLLQVGQTGIFNLLIGNQNQVLNQQIMIIK